MNTTYKNFNVTNIRETKDGKFEVLVFGFPHYEKFDTLEKAEEGAYKINKRESKYGTD